MRRLNQARLGVVLLVLVSVLVVTGCGAKASEPGASDLRAVTKQLASSLCTVTVQSGTQTSYGTAFCVGSDWLVTAAHVIGLEGATKVSVFGTDNMGLECEPSLVRLDKEADVAVVKFPGITATVLGFASREPEIGDTLLAGGLAYNTAGDGYITDGVLCKVGVKSLGDKYLLNMVGLVSFPGMSGGPVVNVNGEVVGMLLGSPAPSGEPGPMLYLPVADLKATIEQLTK